MVRSLGDKGRSFSIFLGFFLFYCLWQIKSIYGGDSGDLVTAAWVKGIPHPPGYPLYAFLASFLIHWLPFFTPSWRVALLSSFSSALCLAIFYLLLKKIIRKTGMAEAASAIALLGVLTLAFIYPFWLYSELAEVFALNNLLAVCLTYFLLGSNWFFFFVFGLALGHHQTIILLFPGFLYFIWQKRKIKKFYLAFFKNYQRLFFYFLFFIFGLLFYLYPLFACQKTPLVCWDDPVNFKNLLQLISRADYGTFLSSSNLGNSPSLRFYSLLAAFKFIQEDFRLAGIILILLGFYYLYRWNKPLFKLMLINLGVCFFFLFYASFIVVNDFMSATFERFLILPYIFMVLLLSLGAAFILRQSEKWLVKLGMSLISQKIFLSGLKVCFFLIPLSFFLLNFPKISVLKDDFTAENMAKDFLNPLPEKSILIASSDTTLFNTQYVRYVLGVRKDVIFLSYPLLPAPYYQKIIQKHFPQLILSSAPEQQKNLEEFIQANQNQYPIFVDFRPSTTPENWLPYGLVWRYRPETEDLRMEGVLEENMAIWANFSDPLAGSLAEFENLFLADVLRVYQSAGLGLSTYFLSRDYLNEAEAFLKRVERLRPDNEEVYLTRGAIALKRNECQQAREWFLKALEENEKNALTLGYLRKTALECFKNEEEAKLFENQCLEVEKKKDVFLESLGK